MLDRPSTVLKLNRLQGCTFAVMSRKVLPCWPHMNRFVNERFDFMFPHNVVNTSVHMHSSCNSSLIISVDNENTLRIHCPQRSQKMIPALISLN